MPLFVFISGYFFNLKPSIIEWFCRKIKKLIIPYYFANAVFNITGYELYKRFGFENLIKNISLKTILLDPLIPNTLAGFNSATWFVIILFYIEVIAALITLFNNNVKGQNFLCLLEAMLIVWVANYSINAGNSKIFMVHGVKNLCVMNLLRVGALLPYFFLGIIFKKYLEKIIDNRPIITAGVSFFIMLIVNAVFSSLEIDYKQLTFTEPIVPFVVAIGGITFWIAVSKILSKGIGKSRLVLVLANNTFSIMTFHLFGFFIINMILLSTGVKFFCLDNVECMELFMQNPRNAIYTNYANGLMSWAYVVGSVLISLLISKLYKKIINVWKL